VTSLLYPHQRSQKTICCPHDNVKLTFLRVGGIATHWHYFCHSRQYDTLLSTPCGCRPPVSRSFWIATHFRKQKIRKKKATSA
jgi:hypothetical protein